MPVQTRDAVDRAFAAVRLAAWCNAVIAGSASLDEAAFAVGADGSHRIAGLPGEDGLASLAVGLGRIRSAGAVHAAVALPIPGDAVGLAGPRALTEAAVAAGHAVLISGIRSSDAPHGRSVALIARHVDGMACWEACEAHEAPPPTGEREAAQALRLTVLAAGADLGALDVAPFGANRRSAVEAALRTARAGHLPPCVGATSRRLHAEATRLWLVARLALEDDGGALSVAASQHRRSVLRAVESSSRRALMAVASASSTYEA